MEYFPLILETLLKTTIDMWEWIVLIVIIVVIGIYIEAKNSEKDQTNGKFYSDDKKLEKCPRCGGSLLEKYGKYGKFFGCSNFPKCRFVKKIK
jgi:DNA topoisomerase-1